MRQLGQTLKLVRIAADLKQTELAQVLGVTANYLSLVERGHREPSLTFLRKFATRLGVPLREFLWVALADETAAEADPPQGSVKAAGRTAGAGLGCVPGTTAPR